MQINQTFVKLKLLNDLLTESICTRQSLLDECISIGGTNPTVLMRRFRMLDQLNQFESDIINKIYNVEIDSISELDSSINIIRHELAAVSNRSA